MKPEQFVIIDDNALLMLPIEQQFEVLGYLAQNAGALFQRRREDLVERLRATLTDTEIARMLKVSRAAIARIGAGPVIDGGLRIAQMREAATLLYEVLPPGTASTYAFEAVNLLRSGPGRIPDNTLWSAAQRITMAVKALTPAQARELGDNADRVRAAAAQAAHYLAGKSSFPPPHDADENDV